MNVRRLPSSFDAATFARRASRDLAALRGRLYGTAGLGRRISVPRLPQARGVIPRQRQSPSPLAQSLGDLFGGSLADTLLSELDLSPGSLSGIEGGGAFYTSASQFATELFRLSQRAQRVI